GEAGEMAFAVRARIIRVSHHRRTERTALCAVALARYAMQLIIAVADGLCSRAGLVGSGRSFLQQFAVVVVNVSDCARFWIFRRQQPGERVVGKAAHAPWT